MSEEILEPVWEEQNDKPISKLIAALALAQAEFKPITKDTTNPFFKNKYADLATIIAATQPALSKNGLVVIQIAKLDDQARLAGVRTILAHSSGQTIEADLLLPAAQGTKFDAQTVGSALTYSRRYAMQAILGVAADADEDGNIASGNFGSKEAAQAVAQEKIAELKAKRENGHQTPAVNRDGHAVPRAIIPDDDLEPLLQASIDAQKEKKNGGINYPPIPAAEPPKPRTERGADVDDVVGVITAIKDKKTKEGRAYKGVTVTDIFGTVLELSAFDDFQMSDGRLFQYLVVGAVGQEATFTYATREKNGKTYHNIIGVNRIGSHRWDDQGVGVLDANR